MSNTKINRRDFVKMTAMTATLSGVLSPFNILKAGESPNNILNVATIGLGGQGNKITSQVMRMNKDARMVAFCDCDERPDKQRARNKNRGTDKLYKDNSQIPRFKNFNEMLDKKDKDIDAILIATPDHSHCPIAVRCMEQGKHVYVEKPMAHNINEVRIMDEVAKKYKVATQMGNHGRANSAMIWNWINSDAIGKVEKVDFFMEQTWTANKMPKISPVPKGLDWDLWQGPIKEREYSKDFLPFIWRNFSYYGTGIHGDLGCHVFDAAYWSLKLGSPESVCSESDKAPFPFTDPANFKITFKFPARDKLPPVTVTLYAGKEITKTLKIKDLETGRKFPQRCGQFIIGEKATIMAGIYANGARIIPEVKMQEIGKAPQLFKPNSSWCGSHMLSWVNACKTGVPASSNFDYASGLTEMVLLGEIASRFPNKKLLWDSKNMKITNDEEANKRVSAPTPRKGWES